MRQNGDGDCAPPSKTQQTLSCPPPTLRVYPYLRSRHTGKLYYHPFRDTLDPPSPLPLPLCWPWAAKSAPGDAKHSRGFVPNLARMPLARTATLFRRSKWAVSGPCLFAASLAAHGRTSYVPAACPIRASVPLPPGNAIRTPLATMVPPTSCNPRAGRVK